MIRLFFSGTPSMTVDQKAIMGTHITRRLNSCHGDYIREALIWGKIISSHESTIEEWMLDSGAFTAWSRGDVVSLDHVMRCYDRAMETMTRSDVKVWLINLDVIPGRRGVDPTPAEIAAATRQSDINFEILHKRYGDIVLPVFHQGEPESRLREVLQQTRYIGVSPRNDLPEHLRVRWSDQVHQLMGDGRSHGLAATGAIMTKQVPWWSVDSASWLYSAAMGSIDILVGQKLLTVAISDQNPQRKERGKHFDTLPEQHQQLIVDAAASMNIDMRALITTANARVLFCGIMNQRWADQVVPTAGRTMTLFDL
jgi:hypothetical protein